MGNLNQVGIFIVRSTATDQKSRGFFCHFHHDLAENKAFIASTDYYSRCIVMRRRKRRRGSGLWVRKWKSFAPKTRSLACWCGESVIRWAWFRCVFFSTNYFDLILKLVPWCSYVDQRALTCEQSSHVNAWWLQSIHETSCGQSPLQQVSVLKNYPVFIFGSCYILTSLFAV